MLVRSAHNINMVSAGFSQTMEGFREHEDQFHSSNSRLTEASVMNLL